MTLLTKVGSFQKPNTATGTQSVTGLGFIPKAIIFWSTGTDLASGSWKAHVFSTIGFTAAATNSFSVATQHYDAFATTETNRRMAAKAITFRNEGAQTSEADLVSFDADGFTLNWTTNALTATWHINYLALGGSDLSGARVVNWTIPTTTINKAVVGAGFSPDLVFHASALAAAGNNFPNAHLCFGAMNKHGQQWANSIFSADAVSPSNTSRWQQTDACFNIVNANEQALTEAHYVSMDADGFTTHFSANAGGNAFDVISLCLKGVSSKIGSFSKTTAAAPAAQKIERVGFKPKAILVTNMAREKTSGPAGAAYWSMGATDGTAQRAVLMGDDEAQNPTKSHSLFLNDAFVTRGVHVGGTPTLTDKGTVTSLENDGFGLSFSPNQAYPDEVLYLALGDAGINTFPKSIGSITASDATAFSNQRKIDTTVDGTILEVSGDAAAGYFNYSKDKGVSWNYVGTMNIDGFDNGSIFIDLDDYLHVVWKQAGTGGARTDGYIYYMRGTPNAGRTAWTYGAAQVVNNSTIVNFPDLIVHREGAGWQVHIVASYFESGGTNLYAVYRRVLVDSAGGFTQDNNGLAALAATLMGALSGNYGVVSSTFPSIDFNHNGDSKTIGGGTPHLYIGWSAGGVGAGKGMRFRKAVYGAGAWTWNPEREIDTRYYINDSARYLPCMFDGTRVVMAGVIHEPAVNDREFIIERDAADTTTTLRGPFYSNFTLTAMNGSTTYDGSGNVYILGSPNQQGWFIDKWERNTNTMTRINVNTDSALWGSMKRGYSHSRIEWIYTSGNNSPYLVRYDKGIVTPSGLLILGTRKLNDLVRDKLKARGLIK